jgi:arginine deiminase
MSREHFVESHLEDRVNELIYNENLSEEDAIRIATSEHDGQVNLVEDKALKIHNLETNFTTSIYSSAILVNKITDYLEANRLSDSQSIQVNNFCVDLQGEIDAWRKEIDNGK